MIAEHLHPDDIHPVHITINGKKVVAPDDELTGRQIKELGGVNPANSSSEKSTRKVTTSPSRTSRSWNCTRKMSSTTCPQGTLGDRPRPSG